MAYSTGAGDYIALMNGVLVHAIADGWTEVGGVGTGWPIAKGDVGGVDWSSYESNENDYTENGDGVTKLQRYMRLGIGTTGAEATANAATTSTICANFSFDFTEWHIFSDASVNDHIHVVARFTNASFNDVFIHFSFGEVDKNGLTYGSVTYATATNRRGYAAGTSGGSVATNSGNDWNSIIYGNWPFAGNWGEVDGATATTSFIIRATDAPTPDGIAGYPSWDTVYEGGTNLWAQNLRTGSYYHVYGSASSQGMCLPAFANDAQVHVGQVSFMPIMFVVLNGLSTSSRSRYLGTYPNIRACRTAGIEPGEEFTMGADTWVVFPMTRSTIETDLNVQYKVTSGRVGFAYKKVV